MDDPQSFSCRIDNIKSVTDVLNCLSVEQNKDQPCHIEASTDCKLLAHFTLAFSYCRVVTIECYSYIIYCCWTSKDYSGEHEQCGLRGS